jgi:hypothetical protein
MVEVGPVGNRNDSRLATIVVGARDRPAEIESAGIAGTGRPVGPAPDMMDLSVLNLCAALAMEHALLRRLIASIISDTTRGGIDAHFVRPEGIVQVPKDLRDNVIATSWSRFLGKIVWSKLVRGFVVVQFGSKARGGYARESRDKTRAKRERNAARDASANARFAKRARTAERNARGRGKRSAAAAAATGAGLRGAPTSSSSPPPPSPPPPPPPPPPSSSSSSSSSPGETTSSEDCSSEGPSSNSSSSSDFSMRA